MSFTFFSQLDPSEIILRPTRFCSIWILQWYKVPFGHHERPFISCYHLVILRLTRFWSSSGPPVVCCHPERYHCGPKNLNPSTAILNPLLTALVKTRKRKSKRRRRKRPSHTSIVQPWCRRRSSRIIISNLAKLHITVIYEMSKTSQFGAPLKPIYSSDAAYNVVLLIKVTLTPDPRK